MIEEGAQPNAPFEVILVWKFPRFTRKREHAVAFKSMLRRKGIRVVSITEHAEDSPTGKLMEAIIESVEDFYRGNLAQDVTRGMREAASRGFFLGSKAPFGYTRVKVNDGVKAQDPVRVEGAWPALVSKELFKAVQEAMRERAPKVQRPARVGSRFLLSGLLKCGVCGRPYSGQGAKSGQFAYYICGTLFREGAGTCSARYLNAPRVEDFVVENMMDERQSIRKIAVLVGGGLKPLRISDKAEAPQGPLPRHESTRNRLPGPCGVCRSLSSRLPAVRSSFVERGALHANCRADSCGREDVRVLRGPALGGFHAGRKAQGLEAHPVRPVVLAVREGDPA